MKYFDDSEQFDVFLQQALNEVVEDISQQILEKLRENIMANTYELGGSNRSYFDGDGEPTYEFLDAFRWGDVQRTVDGCVKQLTYDYMTMGLYRANNGYGAHIGRFGEDMRAGLVSLLDANGMVASKKRKEFWNPTIQWINLNFDEMVITSFKKIGLTVTKE